jgi:hypothetical protein
LHNRGSVSSTHCPLVADLDTWSSLEWRDGLQVDELGDLESLVIHTRNSTYEIIVMDRHKAEVLVRGGRFFPAYTPARLAGSSLGGSFLKLHGIYVGFSMELHAGETPIITSAVRHISILRDAARPS